MSAKKVNTSTTGGEKKKDRIFPLTYKKKKNIDYLPSLLRTFAGGSFENSSTNVLQ